ncbi:MAG: hypothetical protein Tsb009_35190 [Planctomycetaceae bacterium]
MYLSDRDILWAIKTGKLIVNPPPDSEKIGPSSFDLHLDRIEEAKIWDVEKYSKDKGIQGEKRPELKIGDYNYGEFSKNYLRHPPDFNPDDLESDKVVQRGHEVIIRNGGFILWQTREKLGTPGDLADYVCFVEGKSTKARSGLVVHLTAPNIHATWSGNITLEIVNLGPFDLVLKEGDSIAQATIAKLSSPPLKSARETQTFGQKSVHGADQ